MGRERHGRQPHSAQFIVPVSNFLGSKFNAGVLHVIETGWNVLDLNLFDFVGSQFDEVALESKLLGVGVDDFDDCSAVGWVF